MTINHTFEIENKFNPKRTWVVNVRTNKNNSIFEIDVPQIYVRKDKEGNPFQKDLALKAKVDNLRISLLNTVRGRQLPHPATEELIQDTVYFTLNTRGDEVQ